MAHRLLRVSSARELAEVMAAVGLAQNFAALRALSTEGIQRGHMTLHARSCAVAAGAEPEVFETVVERLVESGEIKTWKAKEIVAELAGGENGTGPLGQRHEEGLAAGHGKVILFGEHAAVYGSHAVAAPIPMAVQAKVEDGQSGVDFLIPRWGIEEKLTDAPPHNAAQKCVDLILRHLGVREEKMLIEVFPHVPRAMSLGGSAALAVAVVRAVARRFELDIDDRRVNELAFASEKIVHGTPSGIDNTLATFGQFILFRKGTPAKMETIEVSKPLPIVIGMTGVESLTQKSVAAVNAGWQKNTDLYERIFAEIDSLSLQGTEAIRAYDLPALGELMNTCQGLLGALQISSWELEELINIARRGGALGAKLTGAGSGGSMVALCPEEPAVGERIADDMRSAGYRALVTEIG